MEINGNPAVTQTAVKKSGKSKKILIAAVLVVVLALGWCFGTHLMAEKSCVPGSYEKAVKFAGLDPLFSASTKDKAARGYADDLIAEGEYADASRALYTIKNEDMRREGFLVLGEAIYEFGNYSWALERTEDYKDDPGFTDLRNRCYLCIAIDAMVIENMDVALENLEQIRGEVEGLTEAYDYYYCILGNKAMEEGSYDEAIELYAQSNDPVAIAYGSMLTALKKGDILAAVEAVGDEARPGGYANMVILENMTEAPYNNIDRRLRENLALAILEGDRRLPADAAGFDALEDTERNCDKIDIPEESKRFCRISAEELARCGTAGTGKVLFVREQKTFYNRTDKADEEYYAVAMYLMEQLPEELCPASLEEVEYIIYLKTDRTVLEKIGLRGTARGVFIYKTGVAKLQLKLTVYVTDANGEEIYRSEQLSGNKEMHKQAFDPDWYYITCFEPKIGEAMLAAVEAVT